jgi:ADP-ribose pyrophosphatase YjhB (NUDIX family)
MDKKPLHVSDYLAKDGTKYVFEYFEADSFAHLPHNECSQILGIAFHGDKIIVVNNIEHPGKYTLIGGGVDGGENPDDSLVREIQEESNMNVLHFQPIGYQSVVDTTGVVAPYYQLRYFCVVEPYGPFVSDPAGDVTEVLEIDPRDYRKYFDWGEKSDLIINRALKLKEIYDSRNRR